MAVPRQAPVTVTPRNGALLRVDLGAVRDNYREVRRRYRGRELTAVVKSDAYGLGLEPVARALSAAGCRTFWVNDLDEGIRLRMTVPDATVYALFGLHGCHPVDFEAVRVIPVLASLSEVERCAHHVALAGRRMTVAIQLDTGLGRLGLVEEEVTRLAARSDLLQALDVRVWVSQLAAFNLPDDPCNETQYRRLVEWTRMLPPGPVSLASSSGVYMAPEWHFDVCRVGSALYGVQTSVVWQEGLKPCYQLVGRITRAARFPAGRRLGYRGVTTLSRDSRVATVGIGYANGLPQGLAECGKARLGALTVPIVGGVAMNLTMIDVTDVPEIGIEGAEAVFFDAHLPIEPVASALGIAPNAILTQIGAGTPRHYLDAEPPAEAER